MKRRRFNTMLGAAGLTLSQNSHAMEPSVAPVQPDVIQLSKNGWMPNNEHREPHTRCRELPVLLYRNAITGEGHDPAAFFEVLFDRKGPAPQWRDGVYDFHNYHSTAHEVLGFLGGHATLIFGGENGHRLEVRAGDIAVLPTGTGHCKLAASTDFLVVGACPPDQHWDICPSAPSEEDIERMRHLPFPKSDPVAGMKGPLTTIWRSA